MLWLIFSLFLFFSIAYGAKINDSNGSSVFCVGHGWTIWQGNCYKLFTLAEAMNFAPAENLCRKFDSRVASVHSDAENMFLASVAKEAFLLLEKNVPIVKGQSLNWDRIQGGLWIGYRRHPSANAADGDQHECSWADGTPMDYANAPLSDTARWQTKETAHVMGYPWEGPNPDDFDHSGPVCGTKECRGDSDQCVEMLNWPGSILGTWNDLSCTHHKLSGVFCKKPVNCVRVMD